MLRRRARDGKWAKIFADDLMNGCSDLFAVLGGEVLTLPISIPIDEQGVVLLQPQGPLEAPRVPARMTVTRPAAGAYLILIERVDGEVMVIPGLCGIPLATLMFRIMDDGLEIGPGPLPLDESTARALANALLLAIGMKLTKSRREAGPSGSGRQQI